VIADHLLAHEALILRLRLESGLVSLEDIESWAEEKLLSLADPPFELIELATARTSGLPDALAQLIGMGGDVVTAKAVVRTFSIVEFERLAPAKLEAIFSRLNLCAAEFAESSEEGRLLNDSYWVGDLLSRAVHGSEAIDDALLHVASFFRRVRELSAASSPA